MKPDPPLLLDGKLPESNVVDLEALDANHLGTVYWHQDKGGEVMELTKGQLYSLLMLRGAGQKQILSFLSGEGGMGKTLLICLLTQLWRSQGRHVLVCASSAKAAQLIGGTTVHESFGLHGRDGFQQSSLDMQQHTVKWALLYTSDIIIIDEVVANIPRSTLLYVL